MRGKFVVEGDKLAIGGGAFCRRRPSIFVLFIFGEAIATDHNLCADLGHARRRLLSESWKAHIAAC